MRIMMEKAIIVICLESSKRQLKKEKSKEGILRNDYNIAYYEGKIDAFKMVLNPLKEDKNDD